MRHFVKRLFKAQVDDVYQVTVAYQIILIHIFINLLKELQMFSEAGFPSSDAIPISPNMLCPSLCLRILFFNTISTNLSETDDKLRGQ